MPSNNKRKAERSAVKAEKSSMKTTTKKKQEVKGERTTSKVAFKKKRNDKHAEDMGDPKFMHRAPYTSFNIKKVIIDEPGKGFTPHDGTVVIYMPLFNYKYPIFDEDGVTPKLDEDGNPIEELHHLKFEGPRAKDEQMLFRWGITEKLVALTKNETERKGKGEIIKRTGTNKYKCAGELEYSIPSHKTLRRIFLELSDIAIYYLWQNGAESEANGLCTTNTYSGAPQFPGDKQGMALTIHNYPDNHIRNPVWYKSEKEEKEVKDPKTKKVKTVSLSKFIETAPATLTFDVNIGHTMYRTDFRYVWKEKIIVKDRPVEVIKKKTVTKNSELKLKGFVAIPVFEVKMSINNTNNRIRFDATTFIITKYLTSRENEQGATMRELEADMKGTGSNVYTRDELLQEHPEEDALASVTSSEDESNEKDNVKKMIIVKKGKNSSSGSNEANSGSKSGESSGEEAINSKRKKKKQQSLSESSASSNSTEPEPSKKSIKKSIKKISKPVTKPLTKSSSTKTSKKFTSEASKEEKSTATLADDDESSMKSEMEGSELEASELEASEMEESRASESESERKSKIKVMKTLKVIKTKK